MLEIKVKITLKEGVLDPISQTLELKLKKDYNIPISNFKMGKYIQFNLNTDFLKEDFLEKKDNKKIQKLEKKIRFIIKNILSNKLIENSHIKIKNIKRNS